MPGNETLDQAQVARYLSVLGVDRKPPSASALHALVAAHLMRVSFENISKLYRQKHAGLRGVPPVETFLDGIERCHFGGTCYANNFHFYSLLASLGYRVKLCGADMSNPNVHMVCLVEVDGREFLIDVGYAAPFYVPLPRDLTTDHIIDWGNERYVLKPQEAGGRSRLELYREGAVEHGYVVNPEPRQLQSFAGVIADSFRLQATFLNAVLLTRFYPGQSVIIHNLTLTRARPGESVTRTLGSREELVAVVEQEFGIPQAIAADALSSVEFSQGAWN